MPDEFLLQEMRKKIDLFLRHAVDHALVRPEAEFKAMFDYQLGLNDAPTQTAAQGKRLRPLILLLSTYAACGQWEPALPAAAAVELLHNFSLIHDDIQDNSPLRRGRPTIWVKWGEAQAINAGDGMLGLAQLALLENQESLTAGSAIRINRVFNEALVELTRGQYLDIAYEKEPNLPEQQYIRMSEGKTGALIAACMEIGAIIGGASTGQCSEMAHFGREVGKAFQIQDDWLGIWGDENLTGKSTRSDLIERKKTYPVLLGIAAGSEFLKEWKRLVRVELTDADRLAKLLENEGAKEKTEMAFAQEYEAALSIFRRVDFPLEQKQPLSSVIDSILTRMK